MSVLSKMFLSLLLLPWGASGGAQTTESGIELEDAVASSKFTPRVITGFHSMKDGEYYTVNDAGTSILRYSYQTGRLVDTVFTLNNRLSPFGYIDDYQINDQETLVLITANDEAIYRNSYVADYWIYDRKQQKLKPLSENGKQQLAGFSPDGNAIAFVRDNNLFINKINADSEIKVTNDGKHNEIINGKPDWVYEEEFGFTKGYAWSADGTKLAYMRFDEKNVKEVSIPVYEQLYPSEFSYKYPKAGEVNSKVSVWVYDLASGNKTVMETGEDTNQYIPQIKWTVNADQLGIVRLNRRQDKVEVLLGNTTSGKSRVIYKEYNKRFISEINEHYLTFPDDGKHFLVFSERSGYMHIYKYTLDGSLVCPVTSGDFDVDKFLGIDGKHETLYYTSSEYSPLERDVFRIKLDGSGKKRFSYKKGTNMAGFSNTFSYYINTWSDANTPPIVSLRASDGKLIRVLEENQRVQKLIKTCNFSPLEFITVPSDSLRLNGFMIKPPDFDPRRKYPLFMYVYGGPESQEVRDEWNKHSPWFQYLVQQGYIVACIDNRGTDGRGEAFRKCTYLQLGKLETQDQLNAAHYFASLPYVDGSRIGIFGWSYGGYLTSLCMTRGKGTFKMGIAVAPVTNWRFYDSVYTERFMQTPQENASGYDTNAPLAYADSLQGKFLLIHGSADDNVHMQNSMMFSERLIQFNKKFDMAVYPNCNHGIYGGNTRLHLYSKMTDFILENL